MTITNDNKFIAKTALNNFGVKPIVTKYWDDNNVSNIDILESENRPYEGVTSNSTIGLSDVSTGYSVEERDIRVKIVGACAASNDIFSNILSTCAFNIINSKLSISHGQIFNDVVNMHYPNSEMKHVLFTSPFLWEDLMTLDFSDKKVAWLLAIPISTDELLLAEKEGKEAL